jgi:hypothetical protein
MMTYNSQTIAGATPPPAYHAYAMNRANQIYLNRDEPHKQVKFSGQAGIINRLTGTIFGLALLIGAAIWGYLELNERYRLAREGVNGQAIIVDLSSSKSSSRNGSSGYNVTYQFTVINADGTNRVIRKTESVSAGFYMGLRIGATVPVIYLPDNLNIVNLTGNEDHHNLILAMTGAGLVIGLVLLFTNLWQFYKLLKLRSSLKKGQILLGRIEICDVKKNILGKPSWVKLTYSINSPQSGKIEGYAKLPAKYFRRRWHVCEARKPVPVLYLSENNHRVL